MQQNFDVKLFQKRNGAWLYRIDGRIAFNTEGFADPYVALSDAGQCIVMQGIYGIAEYDVYVWGPNATGASWACRRTEVPAHKIGEIKAAFFLVYGEDYVSIVEAGSPPVGCPEGPDTFDEVIAAVGAK